MVELMEYGKICGIVSMKEFRENKTKNSERTIKINLVRIKKKSRVWKKSIDIKFKKKIFFIIVIQSVQEHLILVTLILQFTFSKKKLLPRPNDNNKKKNQKTT